MRIKKNGWGTVEMLVLSGCLLFALIVAIYFISKLYGSLDNAIGNRAYVDMESKLETAARTYINENNITISGETKITLSTLINADLIDEFNDENGKSCAGYVLVNRVESINYYNAYISCDEYQTKNY